LKGRAPFEFNKTSWPTPKDIYDFQAKSNRAVVRICDPHLPLWPDHIQYQEAKARNFFLKNPNGTDFVRNCWPGICSFPDFLNTSVAEWYATKYYYGEGRDFTTEIVHFWNDMNEYDGPDTIMHLNGFELRETHATIGHHQSVAAYRGTIARNNPPHRRGFILGRGFYVGAQRFMWYWTGDNSPTYKDLGLSLPMILSTALVGNPFSGEDVGGHTGDPTAELLVRWFQLAAWVFPFFREHSSEYTKRREPYRWPEPTYHRLVDAVYERYKMIGLWYTHSMYSLRDNRGPVVPLFWEYPEVESFHENDHQGLLGDSVMAVPVVEEKATSVFVEKPPGYWYEWRSGRPFKASVNVSVTMEDIPLYLRGGRIVPVYDKPLNCAYDTIQTDMTLVIGVDEQGKAEGTLFLDDGITYNYTIGVFIHRRFKYENGVLRWNKEDPSGEKAIPEFLKKAKVTTLKIYTQKSAKTVRNLNYLVGGEWVWPPSGLGESNGGGVEGWHVVAIVGIVLGIVCVVVAILAKRRERLHDEELLAACSDAER
jgi:alpha-glucosidase (family GH31 glycosyl hydrolase)